MDKTSVEHRLRLTIIWSPCFTLLRKFTSNSGRQFQNVANECQNMNYSTKFLGKTFKSKLKCFRFHFNKYVVNLFRGLEGIIKLRKLRKFII